MAIDTRRRLHAQDMNVERPERASDLTSVPLAIAACNGRHEAALKLEKGCKWFAGESRKSTLKADPIVFVVLTEPKARIEIRVQHTQRGI